jgi:hypothetical protein
VWKDVVGSSNFGVNSSVVTLLDELLDSVRKHCNRDDNNNSDKYNSSDGGNTSGGSDDEDSSSQSDKFVFKSHRMPKIEVVKKTIKPRMSRVSQVLKPIEYTGFPALIQTAIKVFKELLT